MVIGIGGGYWSSSTIILQMLILVLQRTTIPVGITNIWMKKRYIFWILSWTLSGWGMMVVFFSRALSWFQEGYLRRNDPFTAGRKWLGASSQWRSSTRSSRDAQCHRRGEEHVWTRPGPTEERKHPIQKSSPNAAKEIAITLEGVLCRQTRGRTSSSSPFIRRFIPGQRAPNYSFFGSWAPKSRVCSVCHDAIGPY